MRNLLILLVLLASISNLKANETSEVCYYGLYDLDTNKELMTSDSKEYLASIEHEWQSDNYDTLIEISHCESNEVTTSKERQ